MWIPTILTVTCPWALNPGDDREHRYDWDALIFPMPLTEVAYADSGGSGDNFETVYT